MTSAQYQAQYGSKTSAKTPPRQARPKPTQEDVPKRDVITEAAKPPKAKPLRWELAGALYEDQFPGTFRLVVLGQTEDLPRVLDALSRL